MRNRPVGYVLPLALVCLSAVVGCRSPQSCLDAYWSHLQSVPVDTTPPPSVGTPEVLPAPSVAPAPSAGTGGSSAEKLPESGGPATGTAPDRDWHAPVPPTPPANRAEPNDAATDAAPDPQIRSAGFSRDSVDKPAEGQAASGVADNQLAASAVAVSPEERPPERPSLAGKAMRPLEIPPGLPGGEAPPIRAPAIRPGASDADRRAAIERLYQELPLLRPEAVVPPGGAAFSLAQLEELAMTHSPLVRQALADVEAARGTTIQAGTYPNPHAGFEGDSIGTDGNAGNHTGGYQGINVTQNIDTGGKLNLNRQIATVDWRNAELALARTRLDLATQVRGAYFSLLVARESVRVNEALVRFADNIYHAQVARVTGGESAPYEPLLARVLSVQARTQLFQAQNSYLAAWRQLAATLNCPEMTLGEVAGRVDMSPPQIAHQEAVCWMLEHHTDLLTAQNSVAKARYQVRLARITPWIPNLDALVTVQKDYTNVPPGTTVNVQLGAPLPFWDKNRGNIIAAEAGLVRAGFEYDRARNALLSTLADAYNRYETNRLTAYHYRHDMLVDQVRAYRALYERYQSGGGDVQFTDLSQAQQTLAGVITSYLAALGAQWQALVDLAGTIQTDDLFHLGQWQASTPQAAGGGQQAP
jgi:cobalt-zinc-cadmium efflux system outer membrane protein